MGWWGQKENHWRIVALGKCNRGRERSSKAQKGGRRWAGGETTLELLLGGQGDARRLRVKEKMEELF